MLAGGILVLSTRNMPLAQNREEQARAILLAEAAASHGLALLRGPVRTTPYNTLLRDSLFVGYGLASASEIPATGVSFGGGRYHAKIIDDPGATEDLDRFNDVNNRLVLRCTGVTRTGATAVINALVGPAPIPAFLANGNVTVGGSSAQVLGPCGSVHANGNLGSSAGSGITVEGLYSATGLAAGSPVTTSGTRTPVESNAEAISIPSYTYSDFCPGSANYILRSDGWLVVAATGVALNAVVTTVAGWRATYTGGSVYWTQSSSVMLPGTYCVQGNAVISSSPGPVSVSIIAEGSIAVSGSPVFTSPAHPDGVLFFAGGDVHIRGTASALYTGAIYSRNQCDVGGNGKITGSIMCLGETTAAPAANFATNSAISGNVRITYDCSGTFGRARRILSWYQTLN
jgi:hypothetical protein